MMETRCCDCAEEKSEEKRAKFAAAQKMFVVLV